VVQRIEVPSAAEFRVSTPVLTDRVEPATAPGQVPQLALAAHRVFPAGGGLYCQYEVFGPESIGGAPPPVTAGFELRSSDGTVVQEATPTAIVRDGDGRLVRLIGASLEDLPEGAYELVLEVRNEVSGERLVRREPFVLARDAR
jgi:hypothetical protein